MYFGTRAYGLEEHIRHHGSGYNMYRSPGFGQPRTLRPGDELANGYVLQEDPFEGFNGGVGLLFQGHLRRIVPARIPLQLRSEQPGVPPSRLRIGQILVTGDVILSNPTKPSAPKSVRRRPYQDEIELHLTGGLDGHHVSVAADLPLAVTDETYPPNRNTLFGAFVIEKALRMSDEARANLSQTTDFY